jgi:Lysyl oxidase
LGHCEPGGLRSNVDAMSSSRARYALSASAAIGLLAMALAAGVAGGSAPGAIGQLLPDLDQQTPIGVTVKEFKSHGVPRYEIGFESAVRNIGDGPLILFGRRASRRTPTMKAYQVLENSDGTQSTEATGGRFRYAISKNHQHWHFLRFDRYELRRAGETAVIVRDQKTGFCLGDRYRSAGYHGAAAPPKPVYTRRCGLTQPKLLSVREGISVGYGDNYLPYLEGQSLPLSGLAAGRYVLTHSANVGHSLRETNYLNNDASVLLDLTWSGSRPAIQVIAECPETADCAQPPAPVASASVGGPSGLDGVAAAG